jgi:HSP20 family protein
MPNPIPEFSMMTIGRGARPSGRLWNPAADVYRTDNDWIVKVDLAGVSADELEVDLMGSILRIRGCRRDTFYRQGFVYHQMEITYSRFEKTIQFPCPLEGASMAQQYRDGFLIVSISCK